MARQLYMIKGTGLNLDGSVVVVTKREGDYFVVSPPNSTLDVQGTMVHEKCLQPFISDQKFTYEIIVYKKQQNSGTLLDLEKETLTISNALRDVSIDTIIEYLNTNLTPILRME